MSKAIHELLNNKSAAASHSLAGVKGDFPIDEAVLEVLPQGITNVSAEAYGFSQWTITARISLVLPDGSRKRYFLKVNTPSPCASGDHGRIMMLGEFTSVTKIHSLIPGLVPAPHGWGKYKSGSPETCFFLSDFLDMDSAPPDPEALAERVAELHLKGTSQNGKFGFEVTTCDGKVPHTVAWEESWAVFFTNLLRGVLKMDTEANGKWPELEAAAKQVIDAVIPRLLGVLQTDGRQIKPSLIHGDCWEGNVGMLKETGLVVLYDAGSYYAHNEMELGIWRGQWGQFFRSKAYSESYFSKYSPAEPQEEREDRNRLYSLKYNLNHSAGHPPNCVTRQTAYNDMCFLCQKYAPSEMVGKYDSQKDPSVTGNRMQAHT
ncbi:MAG: hypothetical protein M1828_000783 [Chrysothrix sp. TS-e1954]|nr:MAG: hypothetical protein M1828_000783 [Chrysothrix sp. TS-e1954]